MMMLVTMVIAVMAMDQQLMAVVVQVVLVNVLMMVFSPLMVK